MKKILTLIIVVLSFGPLAGLADHGSQKDNKGNKAKNDTPHLVCFTWNYEEYCIKTFPSDPDPVPLPPQD